MEVTELGLSPAQALRYALVLLYRERCVDRGTGEYDRATMELWCLRNGIDPASVADLAQVSLSNNRLLYWLSLYEPEDYAQMVLCTLLELQ